MLIYLYRFFKGYVYVKLISNKPEYFLNLCSLNGINIWKTVFKGKNLYFKTDINSFKNIKKISAKFKGRVHITKKIGAPFILNRYKKRYGLFIGFAMFAVLLNLLSLYIWNISVVGVDEKISKSVISNLETLGIENGTKISKIDAKILRNELLLNIKELSWAAVNIEGSFLTVDAKVKEKREEISNEPTNLLAAYDGIVKKIETINGTCNVKVGEAVKKGDLLISGMVEYKDLHTEFVRARGKVTAEVEEKIVISTPLRTEKSVRTGECFNRSVLDFLGIKIPLFLNGVKSSYETEIKEKSAKLFGVTLPLKIITKEFYPTQNREEYFTISAAKTLAEKNIENEIIKFVGDGKIIEKSLNEKIEKDKFVIIAEIKCEKNIIFEEKMLISTGNSR